MAGARAPFAVRLRQERGRARNEQANMLCCLPRQPHIRQQPRVEGRHAHHHRGLRHQAKHLVRIRPRQKQHRASRHQGRVGRHEQAMGMVDRQRVQQHVAVGEAPGGRQGARIGRQIFMTEHCALGAPGGARGVENGGKVVRPARDVCKSLRLPRRQLDQASGLAVGAHARDGNTGDQIFPARHRHEQRRLRIRHEISEFRPRIGGVERQPDRARPHTGKIKRDRFRALLQLCRDPVAGLDAQSHQRWASRADRVPRPP